MFLNPLAIPTLLLAAALYWLGGRVRGWGWVWALAVVLAVPGMLFTLYYAHLFDGALWFYQFRAVPYTELSAAGLGLLAGLLRGRLPRVRVFALAAPGMLLVLLAWLAVPFLKPVLMPIGGMAMPDTWQDGVCIQSTPSTCGPASAATVLRALGVRATEAELARECYTSMGGTENWYLARALRRRGCTVRYLRTLPNPAALPQLAIAGTRLNGPRGPGHFVAVLGEDHGAYLIGDPCSARARLTMDAGAHSYLHFTGFFLVVSRTGE